MCVPGLCLSLLIVAVFAGTAGHGALLLAMTAVWGVMALWMQARPEGEGPPDERVRPDLRRVTERPLPGAASLPVERGTHGPGLPEGPVLPPPRLRWWMRGLRWLTGAVTLLALAGVIAGIVSLALLRGYITGPALILGSLTAFVGCAQFAVFVGALEGERCQPTPQPINSPLRVDEAGIPVGQLAELQFGPGGLLEVGFEPAGWFYIDNPMEMRYGVWRHATGPDLAVIFLHPEGTPRLRFIRRFADGNILVSSTRKADLATDPAAGVYMQVWSVPTPRHLWTWHLDAARLFDAAAVDAGADPMALYLEVVRRFSEAILRARWWWLPGSGLFGELVRMCWLYGVPVEVQIEDGWAPPIARGWQEGEAAR